ncbi:MAG: leucine-rich repeat protein [Faecalibacterium sp.]|nr:leucine-rich repeat protein [Faecalibacterium sp.]
MREPNAVTGITLKDGNTELSDGALVALAPGDTRQITSTVSTETSSAKAFYPDPDKGVYRQQGKMTLNTSYTGLYWKSSNPSIVKVDRNTGLLTAVKNGTATITVYAIADGKRTRATAVKTSFDVYVDSNLPVTREWYPYETQKSIELRTTPTYSSNNLYGTIFAGTELQIDLLHVTKAVVNSKTYWYAPVQVNDDEVVYCDISDQSVIRPMRAPSGNDWWKYKVVWKDGVNIRSFANSYPTTNIVTKIPTNDTVELDLNHTMREPKYGDTWAFARYKQSDGTYVYGWCIESDSNYTQKQDKIGNTAHYSDYIIDDTGAIVVYAAPHYENKIDELTSADGVFQIDVANMVFYDASGVNSYWAPCRYTKNGKTIEGYIEVLADPPTPCGIDREGDWERYEVTNAAGAKSIHYPATFELSELSSYDQGEIIWLDRNERVTITENGKQYTFMRGHGDDFVAGWFDVTNVNEPLTQVDDSIEEVISVRSGASVYTFCRGNVSWAQAAQYAASRGGHLVVIDNAQEDAMLHSTIMSAYGGTAWTGGHANGAGNGWTWLNNNTMSYQNWGSSSATPTSSHTALAIKGDYEGWFTYRDCANPYVDSFIVEVEETPRAWFTYRTKAKLNIRKSQSISGAVATTTAVGDYLTIDLLNVAMDSNKKYFFAPVLMSDGSILYCNIGDKTAIVPDLEPDEPAWTQYKALSSLYVRTFPNTWCDTGVLKTLSKGTILELDVSHKLRDPRFGNDWAYARYKQSDGTYLYGWVIAANSYVEQVKQTPVWYDYFANPGSTVYVYKTQNVDDTIVKTYTSGSSFQVDVNNTRQDQNSYFWAPVADSTGKELGYIDLSAVHAGSKSAAIPDVYCQSGWKYAYVLEDGLDVLAAPNEAAALVKHMNYTDNFWFDDNKCYTDAKGRAWTCIYAQKDYGEMADGGWVMLNENINYVVNTGVLFYPMGYTASYNGITYTLYSGYNSWSEASGFCAVYGGDEVQPVRMRLATVHNDAEQAIIEELLNATSTVDKAWIGASKVSGAWKWVDGTALKYSQWGYNEPNSTGSGLAASFDGSWYASEDGKNIHIQGFITEQFTGIGLPQVKLPTSTFYVDDEAFVGNSTIQSVVAPDGLQVIGTRAFADCANLKCITLPDSVSYIAEDAFENTPDVVIFASVGSYAWQWAEKQGIPHGTPYIE